MNFGPLLFLGLFASMALSWFAVIYNGHLDIGRQKQSKLEDGSYYPSDRTGLAHQGAQVYRANGCYYCHTMQVGQTGHEFDVKLIEAGTNTEAVVEAIMKVEALKTENTSSGISMGKKGARSALKAVPFTLLRGVDFQTTKRAEKAFEGTESKLAKEIKPLGPDFNSSLGPRRTVAADYAYDKVVMLGNQRIGPDLANVGLRRPDPKWHLEHLYNPRAKVEKSTMAPYPFLFETKKIVGKPEPDAIKVEGNEQVVPKPEAKALVAYLMSLKAATPLFEAPMTVVKPPAPVGTNAPAGATNAPAKPQ